MKNISNTVLLSLLAVLLFVFWLFNYGPLQLTENTVEDCGLWAHNMYNYFLPSYDFAFRRLADGSPPLWNPFQASGFPTLAGLQAGALYPPNILFLLMPAEKAISYSTLFHLCLAGIFMYLLFRAILPGIHPAGGLIAALAFIFNPRMYELVLFPGNFMTACWLPAVIYLSDRVLTKKTPGSGALLAVAISMTFLAGFTQMTAYIYAVMAVFLVYRLAKEFFQGEDFRTIFKVLGLLFLAVATGALLMGPQLLPSYELVHLSARSLGTLTPQMSEVYGAKANALLPWLKGILDYSIDFKLVDGQHPIPPWAVFLLLVPLGAFSRKNVSSYLFFLGIAVISFVLSLGTNTPIYRLYWDYVPTGNWFSTPIRLRLITYFCLSLLAGYGLSSLPGYDISGNRKRIENILLVSLLTILSVLMAGFSLIFLKDSLLLIIAIIGLHFVLISALILTSGKTYMRRREYLLAAFVLVVIVESMFWYRNLVPFPIKVKPKQHLYNRAAAEALRPAGRAHVENGWGMDFYGSPQVPEKIGSIFETAVTTNWEPLSLRYYQEFCNYLTGRSWYYGRFQLAGRSFNQKMFDMLSAEYIIFSDGGKDWIAERLRKHPLEGRYRLFRDLGTTRIYRNMQALDRVNFAGKWEIISDSGDLLHRMSDESFDPKTTALLSEKPDDGISANSGRLLADANNPVQSYTVDYETVEIEVDAPEAGIVWISDSYYPGWRAWVDGAKSKVLRVNHAFRGVYVQPGRHEILMRFMPASFKWGLGLGILGLILLFAELIWSRLSEYRAYTKEPELTMETEKAAR